MITQSELYQLIKCNEFAHKASPEQRICIEFSNLLRVASFEKRLNGVWFHVANEYSGQFRPVFGMLLKAMGKIAGVADYIFLWGNGCGCIEVKNEKTKLSENQTLFKKWCESYNIPFEVVRSCTQGEDILMQWGILRDRNV